MQYIIKKDGTKEPFDSQKIIEAVKKAAERVGVDIPYESDEVKSHLDIVDDVCEYFSGESKFFYENGIETKDMHTAVIRAIDDCGYHSVANAYQEYRDYKNTYAKSFEDIKHQADDVLLLGDRENANFDSSLVSTKGSLIKGYLTKELYKQFYLSSVEKELTKRGDIYIHDLRDMILGSINCCLFDMATVLKNGFEMSNVSYTEPNSVLACLQVIGDITLVASAQQFGGFTIPEIDKTLLPYCKKTFNNAYKEVEGEWGKSEEANRKWAWKVLERELEQGFQSLELKLNTVPCSRGDFAFTTLTFGQWNVGEYTEDEIRMLRTICSTILNVRNKGHNGKRVVFPKLVYLYDKKQIETSKDSEELFQLAVETSSQCMYPDYLSLSSDHGTVSEIFRKYGVVTSPMGCRAYLSPWFDGEKPVTIGRCNIGAVSLNIPVIMEVARKTHGEKDWRKHFFAELDNRMDVIHNFFIKRYDAIKNQKCSSNPLAFTQGGFYRGTKNPDEKVGDLIDYMTASFGVTALDEATYLWTGERLVENEGKFAKALLEHINERVAKYKKKDGHLYAIYGTPAESLCHTQAKQFDDLCKANGVKNPFADHKHYSIEYFTNSFHANVTEEITPFEKQAVEFENFHLCEGGHIQYVRIDNPENKKAMRTLIEHGMDRGFYQGVNFDAAYCHDCEKHSTNVLLECPHCGSSNISVISRVCGYLGYSNVNGSTRMNDGKMAEIFNRKSM